MRKGGKKRFESYLYRVNIVIAVQSGSNTIKALMWNSGRQRRRSSTERVKDRVQEVRASAKKKGRERRGGRTCEVYLRLRVD